VPSAIRERNAAVQAEQARLVRGRLIFDHDLDVLHPLQNPFRQIVQCGGGEFFELGVGNFGVIGFVRSKIQFGSCPDFGGRGSRALIGSRQGGHK
jgi:hypothetical protein